MIAPSGAVLLEANEERQFLSAMANIKRWFKYAEDRNRVFKSLILVTSVVKWGVAAISNSSRASGGSLSLSLGKIGDYKGFKLAILTQF